MVHGVDIASAKRRRRNAQVGTWKDARVKISQVLLAGAVIVSRSAADINILRLPTKGRELLNTSILHRTRTMSSHAHVSEVVE
jgi:hypothetical protein